MLETLLSPNASNIFTLFASLIPIILFLFSRFYRQKEFDVPKYVTTAQALLKPGAGHSKFDSLDDIMKENYRMDKNHVYKVEHPHKDVVIIPAKYVDELKNLPDDQVNFLEDINERFLGDYTKMLAPGGIEDETLTHTIKNNLTPNLGNIMEDMQEEIAFAFEKSIGECKEWTAMYPMTACMQISAQVSGRIFAGPELNRNPAYIKTCLNFGVEGYKVIPAIRPYPKFLRPIAKYWVKECQGPLRSIATIKELIRPVIEKRIKEREKPHDMMTWIMENSPPGKGEDLNWQAMYQLQIATAAMHTTSNTMTHIFFDLAANSDFIPELREELARVESEEPSGQLTKTSLSKLKKMDSFILESQRMNPFSSTGFSRKIIKPTLFSDGLLLPSGITVTTPVSQISMDPSIYPFPSTFDPLRFFKLRQKPGEVNKWQYVTTSKEHLNWGMGVHACPGRFFAGNEIKMVIGHLVREFDVRLGERENRPANVWTEGGMVPDGEGRVWLRRRGR